MSEDQLFASIIFVMKRRGEHGGNGATQGSTTQKRRSRIG
jgi:hypothetical protein